MTSCELCVQTGGHLVAQGLSWRVVRVIDKCFPAFYRVIWQAHVAEWSGLAEPDQALLMRLVTRVEKVLIEHLAPAKINLASLGNQVPHLHWHVIARFDWDTHFPDPIWAQPRQAALEPSAEQRLRLPLLRLDDLVAQALNGDRGRAVRPTRR